MYALAAIAVGAELTVYCESAEAEVTWTDVAHRLSANAGDRKMMRIINNSTQLVEIIRTIDPQFYIIEGTATQLAHRLPRVYDVTIRGQHTHTVLTALEAPYSLSSEHGEREGEAPVALPLEGATRAPVKVESVS